MAVAVMEEVTDMPTARLTMRCSERLTARMSLLPRAPTKLRVGIHRNLARQGLAR